MSHLMDTLLEDQRRMEADPAHISPVVAQAERAVQAGFVSMAGQDSRVARLMVEAAEQRARADRREAELAVAQSRIARLSAEVLTLKGEHDKIPLTGCQIVNIPHACGYLMVEAQVDPGKPATFDSPADSYIIAPANIFVNGRWLDVQDLRAALEHEALVEAIAEAKGES